MTFKRSYKKLLQSGAKIITKWRRYYKVAQSLLQSGAGITKWRKCYYEVAQVLQSGNFITKWRITNIQEYH